MDKHRTNSISFDEFKEWLQLNGIFLSDKMTSDIMSEFDTDKNNQLSQQEFNKMMNIINNNNVEVMEWELQDNNNERKIREYAFKANVNARKAIESALKQNIDDIKKDNEILLKLGSNLQSNNMGLTQLFKKQETEGFVNRDGF